MLFTALLVLFLLFAVIVIFVITSAFLGFVLTRVPFVQTKTNEIKFIVNKLGISSKDIFYDLGSGDGKVCFLVNNLTGAKCLGFELTWWTYLLAQIKHKVKKANRKIEFKNQNFFKTGWQEADFIYAYLYPPVMPMVERKFLKDCKLHTVAIVKDFPFLNIKPVEIYKMPKRHEIYIYKKL